MRRSVTIATLVAAWIVLTTGLAAADPPPAPLADKLPAGSLLYLGWGGAGPLKADLAKTGLGQLLADPDVKPHVDATLTELEAFIKKQAEGKMPPGLYLPLRSLLIDVVWDRPWAVALIDFKMPSPPPAAAEGSPATAPAGGGGDAGPRTEPKIEAVLLVDLGDKADALMVNVNAVLEKLLPPGAADQIKEVAVKGVTLKSIQPPDPGAPLILWGQVKKHLVVALSQSAAEKVIDLILAAGDDIAHPRIAALSADPRFAKVQAKVGGGLFTYYADLGRVRKELLPLLGKKKLTEISQVVAALGFDSVEAIGGSIRPDGQDFLRQCYILAPGAKSGLLVLADQKPVGAGLLATVPGDATFAFVGNLNRVKLLDELEKQLAKFPKANEKFQAARKELEDKLGLNLKTDLAAAIGDGFAIYNSPSAGGFLFTGLTVVAEAKDAAKLKAVLPKLVGAVLEVAKTGGRGGVDVSFQTGKFKDYEFQYMTFKGRKPFPFAPAWCLTDKYFVFSMFPQTLKAALLQIEAGKDGSLAAGDGLAKFMAGQGKGASFVSYFNNRQLIRIVYPVALPLWQMACSMAGKAGIELDVNGLPRQDLLVKYLGDSFGAMVPDADGVLFVGRSATPLSGLAAAPVVGAGLARWLMMPRVFRAKQAVNAVRNRNPEGKPDEVPAPPSIRVTPPVQPRPGPPLPPSPPSQFGEFASPPGGPGKEAGATTRGEAPVNPESGPASQPAGLALTQPEVLAGPILEAKKIKSLANLHGFAVALALYSNDNGGRYPETLQKLVDQKHLPPETVVSPAQRGPGISYYFIGPEGAGVAQNASRAIVVFEDPANYGNRGTNVLFQDGHAAWIEINEFHKLQKEQDRIWGRKRPPGEPGAGAAAPAVFAYEARLGEFGDPPGPTPAKDATPAREEAPVNPKPGPASQPAGPAQTRPDDRGGADSPKALLETLHKAALAKDLDAVVACCAPAYRPPMVTMARITKEYIAKVEKLATLADVKFGPEQARLIRGYEGEDLDRPSPLAAVSENGRVNWDKVKITVAGDKATFAIDGKASPLTMARIGTRWFMVPALPEGMTIADSEKIATRAAKDMERMIQAMDEFERGIDAGAVTKDNFADQFNRTMIRVVGGAKD